MPLQVAIQLYATAKPESADSASFTVAVYELRWACPSCSGNVNGQDLGHMDAFSAPESRGRLNQPCDWCRELDLNACDKGQHEKAVWDDEDDTYDFKATGIRLPPNWVGGYRTRSTDLSTYKVGTTSASCWLLFTIVCDLQGFDLYLLSTLPAPSIRAFSRLLLRTQVYLMFCRVCGEVLQPDRPDRFLKHMNNRTKDGSKRACLVPELDYLLQNSTGAASSVSRAEDRPKLDPAHPAVSAPELEEVRVHAVALQRSVTR